MNNSDNRRAIVGTRIKQARAALGLTQKELSEQIGMPLPSLRDYELGKTMPGGDAMAGFIRLTISSDWLLTGEGSMLVGYRPDSSATVLTAEEPIAQYEVKRTEIDAVLLSGIIAAVDMANPQLGASERAAIAAKAYTEAVSSAQTRPSDKIFLP